ncbi:heme-degrading domain-containing protein [Kineococcus gynurae]|uniref:UPF0303 protein ACFFVI_10025 n=1 Tax=Kineococcus gynurae TaxID=452979 RepID=A0ABV5LTB6_9ACTN
MGAASTGPAAAELLALLDEQEQRLRFDRLDDDVVWRLGCLLRERAVAGAKPFAVAIRRNGRTVFRCALPGSSADNDGWLDRKMAVVDRYGRSSWAVGTAFRVAGEEFDTHARLDTRVFAAHGGAFPLLVRGVGCVGSVAVSGLPEAEDHEFVVSVLEDFLRAESDAR